MEKNALWLWLGAFFGKKVEMMQKVRSKINPILTLPYLTTAHENKYFDRKSAKIKPSDLADLVSAFANAEGGTIVIGISDKTKALEGINGFGEEKINGFINAPKDCTKPMPVYKEEFLDIVNENGEPDRLLLLHIQSSIDQIIRTSNDSTFLRIGDKTRELKGIDLRNLEYSKNTRHYEDECNTDATMGDLDEQLLAEYKHRIGADDISTYQVLKARGFFRRIHGEEHLTNAAVLLFAENVRQFFPNCRIRFIRYDGTAAQVGTNMNIIKDINIEEPLPRLIEKAKQVLSMQLREFTALDAKTGLFKTQPEYPEFAWLEGIVNAVVHREYAMTGNYIRVTMYDDRLEIFSPGKLPNLVTVENIRETRFSRNPQLSRVLNSFGLVRELNEGVKRIYADMIEQNQVEPVYYENDQAVILVLKNTVEEQPDAEIGDRTDQVDDKNTIQDNLKTIQDTIQDVSKEKRILSCIQMNNRITIKQIAESLDMNVASVKYYIRKLHEKQVLKREGNSQKGIWIVLK